MRFPDELLEEIRAKADLATVIGRSIDLRKAGILFKACCPFHSERTASFTVTPARRTYHCFGGCGAHGDVIRWMTDYEGLTFVAAVRRLAGELGIPVPEIKPETPAEARARQARQSQEARLLHIQDKLAYLFGDGLLGANGTGARAYLRQRQVSKGSVASFRLGWCSGEAAPLCAWMQQHEVAAADLVALGVLISPDDGLREGVPLGGARVRFRERLIFPVIDTRGEVVAFGGRVLDANARVAKYINSPETPVYTKGANLYGTFQARAAARQTGTVVLVEGNVDVIALHQAKIANSVAAMGTALTEQQAKLLRRLAPNVVVLMDGDRAGKEAAWKGLPALLAAGFRPRVAWLPAGQDPDDLVRQSGAGAVLEILHGAEPLVEAYVAHVAETHQRDTAGRVEAIKLVAPLLAHAEEGIERAVLRAEIAQRLDVPEHLLEVDEPANVGTAPDVGVEEAAPPWETTATRRGPRGSTRLGFGSARRSSAAEVGLLVHLLAHPDLVPELEQAQAPLQDRAVRVMVEQLLAGRPAAEVCAGASPHLAKLLLERLGAEPPRRIRDARRLLVEVLARDPSPTLRFRTATA